MIRITKKKMMGKEMQIFFKKYISGDLNLMSMRIITNISLLIDSSP